MAHLLDRDELLDIIFWVRVLLGFFIGTTAGVLKLTGSPVIITFGVLMLASSYFYTSKFLEIDETDFNEQELLMEGTGNSIGLFLLSWILCYSYL